MAKRKVIDEKTKETIIKGYKAGDSLARIATEIDLCLATTENLIKGYIAEGLLEKRIPQSQLRREANLQKIREKCLEGLTISEIAEEVGMSYSMTSKYLVILAERKDIPSDWNTERRREKLKEQTQPEGTRRCTREVSRNCVYGVESESQQSGLCRYIQCTNHMRGCPWKACEKFIQISAEEPRRKIIDIDYEIPIREINLGKVRNY